MTIVAIYTKHIQPIMKHINFWTAVAIFFVMPIYTWWLPFLINFWILTWILEGDFKNKFKNGVNLPVLLAFVGYYAVAAISLLWTENFDVGYKTLETQVCFLVAPLLFFASNEHYSQKKMYFIYAFVCGVFVVGNILIFRAFYFSLSFTENGITFNPVIDHGWMVTNRFFSSEFSFLIHPTYMSLYTLASLVLIVFIKSNYELKIKNSIFLLLFLFHLTLVILLSSRSAYILLLLILFSLFIKSARKIQFIVSSALLFFLVLVLFLQQFNIGFRAFTVSNFNDRELNVNIIQKIKKGVTSHDLKNIDPRITIWINSIAVCRENILWGTGIGDVKEEMAKQYKKNNVFWTENNIYNSHNQFLETYVGQGVFGFLLLILLLVVIVRNSIKNKLHVWVLINLIFLFAMIFESIFNTLAGVVFITFFISMFSFTISKCEI